MRHALLPLLLAASVAAVHAQPQGEIRGRVLDNDGLPLPSAHVTTELGGSLFGTVTGTDGRFVLKPLPPGTYTVRISFTGFKTLEERGINVTDRATYLGDRRLSESAMLDSVVIVGNVTRMIEIDHPERMTIHASQLEKDVTRKDPIGTVEKNFPGIVRSPHDDGLHFRGSRTENMVAFIDGVKVPGAVPRVPPVAISSISVYTGGLPARYGDVTGGVLVLETKTYFEMVQQHQARLARAEADALRDAID
jgi:hypothetical protein